MQLAELSIPARAEFVSLARLVVASVVDDRYEITNDQLDNLKLAVSEACALAIESEVRGVDEDGAGVITLVCAGERSGIVVTVSTGLQRSGDNGGFTSVTLAHEALEVDGTSLAGELGLPFIESLVDEALVVDEHGIESLRLSVNCEPSELL